MDRRAASTSSTTIGIIADRCRGRDTSPTVYWNSSPTSPVAAVAATLVSSASAADSAWPGGSYAPAPSAARAILVLRGAADATAPAPPAAATKFHSDWGIPAPYAGGRSPANSSGSTRGRGTYRGWY